MTKEIKLTKKQINYLIKDEDMASKEYAKIYKENPHLKMFKEMSKDERRHCNYLKKLKSKIL